MVSLPWAEFFQDGLWLWKYSACLHKAVGIHSWI